jgi:hypothetical protein
MGTFGEGLIGLILVVFQAAMLCTLIIGSLELRGISAVGGMLLGLVGGIVLTAGEFALVRVFLRRR